MQRITKLKIIAKSRFPIRRKMGIRLNGNISELFIPSTLEWISYGIETLLNLCLGITNERFRGGLEVVYRC